MRDSLVTEIIICGACDGNGYIEHNELEDYHRGEYRYWNEKCEQCQQSGRVMKSTVIKYEPFVTADAVMEMLKK